MSRAGARAGIGIVAGLAFVLLLLPGVAQADYEQVPEHFGVSGEAEQLQSATSMAINASGAGLPAGEAGSIYAVGKNQRVVRYAAGSEGKEPSFREAWGWGVGSSAEGAPKTGFQRCGPALATEPAQHTYHSCSPSETFGIVAGEESGHFGPLGAVAVDQATGDVYVLNTFTNGFESRREKHLIEVFSATGTPIGEGFGEGTPTAPAPSSSIAETPEKLHEMQVEQEDLAVDEEGTVYLTDKDHLNISSPPGESRVMCFKPQSAGDYEHYEYCGQGKDIVTTNSLSQWFTRIALVGGDRLVTASSEAIDEYALGGGSTPICSAVPEGLLVAMAANPLTGEVFYFSYTERKVYRLGACNPETGNFKSLQKAVTPTPKTTGIYALAVNPDLAWGPLRAAGVLYAADRSERKEHGEEQLGIGDVLAPAKVFSPAIKTELVTATGTESSTLRAEIDPHGFDTRFRFEYLDAVTYSAQRATAEGEGKSGEEAEDAAFAGGSEAPLGGAPLGGEGVGTATTAIAGLDPDTEYAFRAIASSECEGEVPPNALCETVGKAAFFRTYAAAAPGLSDGRAYELVSPAQKNGGEVFPADPGTYSCTLACKPPGGGITTVFPMQSAPNGGAVTYMGFPFSPTEGAAVWNDYLSRRTEAGWQTTAMSPALQATKETAGNAFGPVAYDSSLSRDLIAQRDPVFVATAPAGYANLYEQGAEEPGSLTPLLNTAMFASGHPPNRTEKGFKLEYAGHSADFSRQFFAANDALTGATPFAPEPPDPTSVGRDLYESRDGALALLNVAPGNASVLTGASFASQSPDTHAISEDGRRVFWSSGGQLYVRDGGEETKLVSESQRSVADPVGAQPARYLTASADGSRALFASSQELTDDADTGIEQSLSISATGGSFTLGYEGQLTAPIALDTGSNPKKPSAAEVQIALEGLATIGSGEVGVTGSLEAGFKITGAKAMATSDALIEADGSALTGGSLALHATRPGTDLYEWHEGTLTDLTAGHGEGGFQGIAGADEGLSRIYFVDTAVLSGEEENEYGAKAHAGQDNLYLWEAGAGARFIATLLGSERTAEASPNGEWLVFASTAPLTGYDNFGPACGRTGEGERVPGNCTEAFLYSAATGRLTCPSCNPTGEAPRGNSILRRIGGSTQFPWLPQPRYLTNQGRLYFDSSDRLSPLDTNGRVEDVYEYEPESVGSCARTGGCVSLISRGAGSVDSNLLAVDETGANVFFTTRERLSPEDTDELIDLYDARQGGGFPAETETQRGECQGEACQPSAAAPDSPTPGSASFAGAGNLREGASSPAAPRRPCAKGRVKRHGKCVARTPRRHKSHKRAKRNRGGAR